MPFQHKTIASKTTAGADAGSVAGEQLALGEMVNIRAICDVTSAATDSGDELNVYLQGFVAGEWIDLTHWDHAGNEVASKEERLILGSDVSNPVKNIYQAQGSNPIPDNTVDHGPWGDRLRVYQKITDADGDSAFTYTVKVWMEG